MVLIDANIVLRYLLGDHEELSKKAATIIEARDVFVPFEVIAEVVYVLEKVYEIDREEISRSIQEFLTYKNVITYDSDILERALNIFGSTRMDFVDTLLCGYSLAGGHEIISFDKKIMNYLKRQKQD